MPQTTNSARIETLRREMAVLERPARRVGQGHVCFGIEAVDRAAGGGLALGRMHEVNGRAAWSFAVLMAGRTQGAILWCARVRHDHELYPPGLTALGCDPRRLVMAECSSGADVLWAAEEALRSRAVGVVVLEGERALDLTAARRLQLAAEEGGALGLMVSPGLEALFPAASTRWRLEPLEGRRFELEMTRNRNGLSGAWRVSSSLLSSSGLPRGSRAAGAEFSALGPRVKPEGDIMGAGDIVGASDIVRAGDIEEEGAMRVISEQVVGL